MEKCGNCERAIGNMERAFEWGGNVVCRACFDELRQPEARAPVATATAEECLTEGMMTCTNPNCGHTCVPNVRQRGSDLLAVVLFFLGILPGLIYVLFACGREYFCPKCRAGLYPSPEVRRVAIRAEQERRAQAMTENQRKG